MKGMENLKVDFAIKCETLEQKKHIRQVLIDLGYKDDKEWNDYRVEVDGYVYWIIDESNVFCIFRNSFDTKDVITYHDFCREHNIEPIKHVKPQPLTLDQLMNKFIEDVKSFGLDVEFVFKKL